MVSEARCQAHLFERLAQTVDDLDYFHPAHLLRLAEPAEARLGTRQQTQSRAGHRNYLHERCRSTSALLGLEIP